jgi:hypothetical protein
MVTATQTSLLCVKYEAEYLVRRPSHVQGDMIYYLLFIFTVAALIWVLPALVFFFLLGFPFFQSLLFGFLVGSLFLGLCEACGWISKAWRFMTKSERTRKDDAEQTGSS